MRAPRWSMKLAVGLCLLTLTSSDALWSSPQESTLAERLFDEVDSFRSSEGAVKKLLDEGADPNAANEDGISALMIASLSGNEPAVAELLAGGAEVDYATLKGVTALMLAARNDEDEVVKQLLAAGAAKDAVDEDGWPALMFAAWKNALSAVEALVEAGANPSVVGNDGWSAVQLAVNGGHATLLERLLAAGAEVPAMSTGDFPTLVRAVFGADSEVLLAVIERHPDLEVRGPSGETPLIVAAARGETEIVMELLRKGADVTAKDQDERTALSYAEENGFEEIQALLGGTYQPRRPETEAVVAIECDEMEGTIEAAVRRVNDELELAVYYPKPLGYYLGGFEGGSKTISAGAEFFLDTDDKRKTGQKPEFGDPEVAEGAEFAVDFSEMRTSVATGDARRYVHRQVMAVDIERNGETLYSDDMEGYSPSAERDLNKLSLTAPLEVFGLTAGQTLRVGVEVGFCAAAERAITLD